VKRRAAPAGANAKGASIDTKGSKEEETSQGKSATAACPCGRGSHLKSSPASWLVSDGASIYSVSKLLGHSSVMLTQKYYAQVSPKMLDDAVGKIRIGLNWTIAKL